MNASQRAPAVLDPIAAPRVAAMRPRAWQRYARRAMSPLVVAPLLFGIFVLVVWQAGVFHTLFNIKTFTVPYPSSIADALGKSSQTLIEATWVTIQGALLGYAVGMSLGLVIASAMVRYAPGVVRYAMPLLSATNALPIIALAPLLALWIDPGIGLKTVVVVFMTVPTMVAYAVRGLTNVDPSAVELMDSIDASPNQLYGMVRMPTALPFVFTALKSAVVLALIGTIVTEAVRGFEGLGAMIEDSLSRFDASKAWLALIAIAAIGIVWYTVVQIVERIALPWEEASRRRT
jgi:NitT/TauT family transport system permease protein